MKYQVIFSMRRKKYSRLSSAAVVTGALRVNTNEVFKVLLTITDDGGDHNFPKYGDN